MATVHLDQDGSTTSCGTMWGACSTSTDVDEADCRRCLRRALKDARRRITELEQEAAEGGD